MIITEKQLKILCRDNRWNLSDELKQHILKVYGEEPDSYSWTEQDLFEQVRKLVVQGRQTTLNRNNISDTMSMDSG